VGKRTAGEFFSAVEHALLRPVPVPADAAASVPSVPGVPAAPVFAAPRRPSDAWAMTSAFSAGGVVALTGVALGWTLARRARRR
jgi:hypothetical protein